MSASPIITPPGDRAALRDADQALEGAGTLGEDVLGIFDIPELREAVHAIVHALTEGQSVQVVTRPADDYTPQTAADVLGVSRKLVNKLIATGELRSYTLPGSRYTKIPVAEVDRLVAERERMRAGVDEIIDGLVEGGGEY